jgi:UDP-N-acetylmuramyl pentapeptide phosphotransferase/UDP-N-acetylglucosamine-1-phosphate transferase
LNTKVFTIVAIVLIAIGVAVFAYQGITYKTQEKVVDLGPLHMTAEKTHTIPLPPILGGIALVGGIVLLVVAMKKR